MQLLKTALSLSLTGIFLATWSIAMPPADPGANEEEPSVVTTATLLREMIDLERLSVMKGPGYRVFQVSSYDRRSRTFGGEHWFANSDGFGKEPIPGVEKVLEEAREGHPGKYLLADVEGPGAIVRTWTARMNGEITMWLDDSEDPTFQGPANEFLQAFYPSLRAEGGPNVTVYAGSMTQRDAGYYPVPFAQRCRIEWSGDLDQLHFYHVEFRRYQEGTEVKTFSPEDLTTWKDQVEDVCRILAKPSLLDRSIDGTSQNTRREISPGSSLVLASVEGGPGRINLLRTKIRAEDLDRALRRSILTISFDRAARSQVEAPLGDFYGAAPGINPFDSIPITVESDGWMTSRFVMPFAESMTATIENRGESSIEIESEILVEDCHWDNGSSLYFNGKWRVDHEMDVGGDLVFDLPYILINGRGRFVGCAAMLLNPAEGPHPSGSWWGEGDEKIFVDDDSFPSFFGTGSEDYFNYSWSSPDLFSHAYFGQPRNDGPGNGGFVSNNRWHILDDIPFESRLSFYMEMFPHTRVVGFSYARTAWFYAASGARDDNIPIFREDLRELKRPEWTPAAVGGTKDALFTQLEKMEGVKESMIKIRPEWAGGRIVSWEPGEVGESLELGFLSVPRTGNYDLFLVMLLSPQSGRFSVKLDGEILENADGEEWVIDLYTPFHTMARRNGPGHTLRLEAGDHVLELVSRGTNPASRGDRIEGDFLWIRERQ